MPPQDIKLTSEAGRDAAGAPAASTRSVLNVLKRYWRVFQEWCERRRRPVTLRDLSERELADIGVTSAEIEYIAAHRAVDRLRDGTRYPWMQ